MNFWISILVLAQSPTLNLPPGSRVVLPTTRLEAGETARIQVTLDGVILPRDRVRVAWTIPGEVASAKILHAGDPDLSLTVRPNLAGDCRLVLESLDESGPASIRSSWTRLALSKSDLTAIEAEPNDHWRQANPLLIGRAVYGTADDVDYLENAEEGKAGLDWFRFEVEEASSALFSFQLELLDRDVSANLRVYRLDPRSGGVILEESGKDPMEIVHDRERERYSTFLSRTLARGIYFVEVNANHPDYILRTRRDPLPPYSDPSLAVEVGLNYLLQVGDAWFAQIPREGNIFVRSGNLHDTSTRCTACHASSFPTEASLVAQANGYPIQAKSSMLTLVDRLKNSPTPLYGPDNLNWQRFIAIPLQAQGKQGGIVLDFDRQVLGRESKEFERFGPFLQAAWRGRRSLPADEVNGVVPADSKFGFAWRDWRVLTEMTRRSGKVAYAQAADAIEDILDDPETSRQVETLQDRIHQLYAWTLIDKARFADRIQVEADALLALQNPDGGWHELDRKVGPSAVYTTGQLTWVLLKAGKSRDDPRIRKALAYLLGQQQPFGGWFQTTTHENFRTPMRETRYAVEALAEAFPRPREAPRQGWQNRDGQPARLPRDQVSIVDTLDDLENLWDVDEASRPEFARVIHPFLGHPEPLVRARAAACLGRLGDPSSIEPLVGRLGDPSKIVGRSAAWALRRLGNEGSGVEAIKAAMDHADPATRRMAVRVFAYQFPGMDGRVDIADRLISRTQDPDLWTRLQAFRSLRQWFYRSNDPAVRRRIIDAYLEGMSRADLPVVRKALSEGMYILLDENLGGGVSLQKNLAALPEKFRRNALKGREDVERDILLGPILAALEVGNPSQREALVRSFDGSFFRGRTYARQPTGMLDVGNDREFGFLVEPSQAVLDRTFLALLTADATPEVRRRSFQLASFFQIPQRSDNATIQVKLLQGLIDPDSTVRDAARVTVESGLALQGAEGDPTRVTLVANLLGHPLADRRALTRAIARNRKLLADPILLKSLRTLLATANAATLRAVLDNLAFDDGEILNAIVRSWPSTEDPIDRVELVDSLSMRAQLFDAQEPSKVVATWLRAAINDPSPQVRERTLSLVGSFERLRSSQVAESLLLTSLVDDSPEIRRLGLSLAATRTGFWTRADARERLLAVLVDPDPRVRDQAMSLVEQRRLAEGVPAIARRVKSLSADPALRTRAEAALQTQGFDSKAIVADVKLGRPQALSLDTFRARINPLFYQPGEDGISCARCHATHNVLRIAEADPARGFDDESIRINYNSALKVINLGDPESSLLLRKPRSPQGQGGLDLSSPNGLNHAGGVRWETSEHPSYRAILDWIREGSAKVDEH